MSGKVNPGECPGGSQFLGHLGDPSVAKGVALMAALAILAVFLGARAFSRAVA
jgi:hypothetical protein